MDKPPATILAELDDHTHRVRFRKLLYTSLPLVVVFAVYVLMMRAVAMRSAEVDAKTAQLESLNDSIDKKTTELAELERSKKVLEGQKQAYAERANSLESALTATLSDRTGEPESDAPEPAAPPIANAAVPPAAARPAPTVTELGTGKLTASPPTLKASVEKLEGKKTALPGRVMQLYSMDLWVEAPQAELRRIREVTYSFSRYYRVKPRLVSSNAANGFRVTTVPLWGCVGTVLVTITRRDGTRRELVFDWCRAASWDERER